MAKARGAEKEALDLRLRGAAALRALRVRFFFLIPSLQLARAPEQAARCGPRLRAGEREGAHAALGSPTARRTRKRRRCRFWRSSRRRRRTAPTTTHRLRRRRTPPPRPQPCTRAQRKRRRRLRPSLSQSIRRLVRRRGGGRRRRRRRTHRCRNPPQNRRRRGRTPRRRQRRPRLPSGGSCAGSSGEGLGWISSSAAAAAAEAAAAVAAAATTPPPLLVQQRAVVVVGGAHSSPVTCLRRGGRQTPPRAWWSGRGGPEALAVGVVAGDTTLARREVMGRHSSRLLQLFVPRRALRRRRTGARPRSGHGKAVADGRVRVLMARAGSTKCAGSASPGCSPPPQATPQAEARLASAPGQRGGEGASPWPTRSGSPRPARGLWARGRVGAGSGTTRCGPAAMLRASFV